MEYTGKWRKLKPVLKFVVIAYFLVFFVGGVFIFKETSLNAALYSSVPALICVCLLWKLRNKSPLLPTPVELCFYEDRMTRTLVKFNVSSKRRKLFLHECKTLLYSDITCVNYDITFSRVTVHGMLKNVTHEWDGDVLSSKNIYRNEGIAAASMCFMDYVSKEMEDKILAAITKYSGKEISRYGQPHN